MPRRMGNHEGFTLVELMIVVAIIGILAAIAIPNFLNFRMKAKTAEAKSNLGAIRSLEVAYFAEWNFFVGAAAQNPRLVGSLDGTKAPWSTTTTFSQIGFTPEGSVFYTYSLLPLTAYNSQSVGFTAAAQGDLDDDGLISIFWVTGTSNEVQQGGDDF